MKVCKVVADDLKGSGLNPVAADVISGKNTEATKSQYARMALYQRTQATTCALLDKIDQILIKGPESENKDNLNFRDLYIAEITDAFGDELDNVRKTTQGEFGQREMSLLLSCLEDGMQSFDKEQKKIFLSEHSKKSGGKKEEPSQKETLEIKKKKKR
mmetsp:Transcript_5660/g.8350  ORF Transcript_5660/g.8350 Transcript_5660/m.8350 type:complete len:158 (-) Transcript_5660:233-706(-)